MGELPEFLSEPQLLDLFGLKATELDQVVRWGLLKKPGDPNYHGERVRDWLELSTKFPGVFLNEKFAAAHLGLRVTEFRRRIEAFKRARTSFDESLYWRHRLDAIYRQGLDPDTIYGSLSDSHEDFAAKLKVRLAPCVVCGEKSVSTVCYKCGELVDPAHCEAVDEGRPLRFRPAEVCFNCIRDFGLDEFEFFRDRRSVRASVERTLGTLPPK